MKQFRVALLCMLMAGAGFLAGRGGFRPSGSSVAERAAERAGIPASAKAILVHPMDSARASQWTEFLDKNLPQHADAIADLLEAERKEGHHYPLGVLLFWQSWAKVDAKGGFAYILRAGDPNEKGFEMATLMKAWVMYDPVAAAEAFGQLDGSPLANAALSGMANGFAGSSDRPAADFAKWLPDELRSKTAAGIAAFQMRDLNIDEAQVWFDALPPHAGPLYRKEALEVLLRKISRVCVPGTVEDVVTRRLDAPWSRNQAEQIVAASAILHSGSSPWDYVSKVIEKYPNPEDPLALASKMAELDTEAALDWVNVNPDHRAADGILAATARVYMQRGNSAEAAALLDRIKDPALRDRAEAKQVVEKR